MPMDTRFEFELPLRFCREGTEGADSAVHGVSAAADLCRVQRAAHGEVGVRGGEAGLRVQRRGRQAHLRHEERGSQILYSDDRMLFQMDIVTALTYNVLIQKYCKLFGYCDKLLIGTLLSFPIHQCHNPIIT